uniref:Macrophage erythroblast attacher n=1 Tax=Anthurium amnicola TaxID=1678845 RepID=A0A1D1XR25_9ARAE
MEMAMDTPMANGDSAGAPAAAPAPAHPPLQHARLAQLAESLKLEHQFLRVPMEHLKKTMRASHRAAEREISVALSTVAELSSSPSPPVPDDDDGEDDSRRRSREEAVHQLTSLVSRLQGLKRKLEEGGRAENLQVQRCRTRLDHLDAATGENQAEWNNNRLKRVLVDYMLRMSYYDTAEKLADVNGIQDLVDIDVFLDAKRVIDALRNKEVAPALGWCAENKSRLKKSKSTFEFQLRLQEFIELVRVDSNMQAIAYARKHLAPWGTSHLKELQRVMATLAFKNNTECTTYKVLFEPKQWDSLVELFKQEFCKLYGMTLEPLLNIYLQAGLTALKTPFCFEEDCTKDDPLSQESFRKLATSLPFSKQQNSKLVCYITKELMDTENPPLVLPNGYVYSTKALEDMAKKNDGRITCPRTGYVCNFSELIKAFIS